MAGPAPHIIGSKDPTLAAILLVLPDSLSQVRTCRFLVHMGIGNGFAEAICLTIGRAHDRSHYSTPVKQQHNSNGCAYKGTMVLATCHKP